MTEHKNLLTACFAGLLALGLAACGTTGDNAAVIDDAAVIDGGGTPASKPGDPPVVSACDEASLACVEARQMALDGAEDALGTLEADDDSTVGQIAAAKQDIKDATSALTEAQMAWTTYQAMQPPTYDFKAMADAVADAVKAPGTLPLTPQADVEGGKVKAKGYDEATWPVIAPWVGWVASVWEMENGAAETEDSVVLYTNKRTARPALYSVYYTGGAAPTTVHVSGLKWDTRPVVVEGMVVPETGAIEFQTAVGVDHGLFKATMLPIGNGGQITYPIGGVKFDGMFHGVAGTFECGAGACVAENNPKGELRL